MVLDLFLHLFPWILYFGIEHFASPERVDHYLIVAIFFFVLNSGRRT